MHSLSLVITIFNEADNIIEFLSSYARQTLLADECVIVDANSTDGTADLVADFAKQNPHLHIKLHILAGNRSMGRNFAISKTSGTYLAMTDAGCILDEGWLEQLWQVQQSSQAQVVGGFFEGLKRDKLQEAMTPYFLQLSLPANPQDFVPTTRSVLLDRRVLEKFGSFNEKLILSEDYELFLRLKRKGVTFAMARQAVVYWRGPDNYQDFIKKLLSFATSDVEAGIWRPKVSLLFARYLFAFLLLLLGLYEMVIFFALIYLFWSAYKHRKHLPSWWWQLPVLQLLADAAVMWGSFRALPRFKTRAL